MVVGRYAWRVARTRARRWHVQHNRGELADTALHRSLRNVSPEQAFDGFVKRFFVDPPEAARRARALARAYPEHAQRTRAAAEQAMQHVVNLLGSGPTHLGPRIDWHRDFKTGLAWPPDDPEALCQAIVRLIDDACLRARLGQAARQAAEREHTWRQNAERLLAAMGPA